MTGKWRLGGEVLLLAGLLLLAVAINWPMVTTTMMYPEQALFYNTNHLIHSFADFIRVYTHPLLLDVATPFARPSGNFLMYQLLTPLLGWHNLAGLMVVNLLFQGLVAWLMIKLYKEFFPGFMLGGYIAASLYLMNPSLLIPKFTIMHFEFAYVFFVLLSCYSFIHFTKINQTRLVVPGARLSHFSYLLASIVCYLTAVTFKEAAIMLGPVLALYLLYAIYQPQTTTAKAWRNKDVFSVFALLAMVSVSLSSYLMLSWHNGYHPLLSYSSGAKAIAAAHSFLAYLTLRPDHYVMAANDSSIVEVLRLQLMPAFLRYTCWLMLVLACVSWINVLRQKNIVLKKSLAFLFSALILFMVLPIIWGAGHPWHLSLSFVCEAMLVGFGIEFYLRNFFSATGSIVLGSMLALILALGTYQIDQLNLRKIADMPAGYALKLNYNAVMHAPAIKSQLNADSILVVQDHLNMGDYYFGDSVYPALTLTSVDNFNFDTLIPGQQNMFWRAQPKYNGTLFRWAYLLPELQEEVVPFTDTDLRLITDAMLGEWLRHINNIFSVAFDQGGNWFDNTARFKQSILAEQKRRHLTVNNYHALTLTAIHNKYAAYQRLPYADAELCKTVCDHDHVCKAFTYVHLTRDGRTYAQCFYYNKHTDNRKHCQICTGYIKST
jgi:hypothetical protein